MKQTKLRRHGCPLAVMLMVSAALAGCQKKQPPISSPSDPSGGVPQAAVETGSAQPESAAAPAAPSASPAPDAPRPVDGVVVPFLTSQLRIFIQQKGRLPESFSEFAGARLDSVPRLEPGLMFAIDPATQEVKIVRK